MKRIGCFFLFFIAMFLFIEGISAASTKFEPTVNMEPAITDNQISVVLGFKGEETMALTQTLAYEDEYLALIDIIALENFTITKSNEVYEDGYKTLKILADSDYSFSDTNYAIAIFELKDKFKDSEQSSIFLYNYEAAGPNKTKVRHAGYEMSLRKDSSVGMLFLLDNITSTTKIRYWFYDHLVLIIIITAIIIGIILFILSIPTKRKKEFREKKISNQLKQENYVSHNIEPIKINENNLQNENIQVDSVVNPFSESSSESRYDYTKSSNESANIILNSSNIEIFNQNAKDGMETIEDIPNSKEPTLSSNTNKDLLVDKGIVELKEDSEDLVLFQPAFDDTKKEDDSKIETLIFFITLILSASLLMQNVYAIENNVSRLRNAIVGNISFDKSLDYNNDGKLDVVDIIYTKNLESVNLDNGQIENSFNNGDLDNTDTNNPDINNNTYNITSVIPNSTTTKVNENSNITTR